MKFATAPSLQQAAEFTVGDPFLLAALLPLLLALLIRAGRELTLVAALAGIMTLMSASG